MDITLKWLHPFSSDVWSIGVLMDEIIGIFRELFTPFGGNMLAVVEIEQMDQMRCMTHTVWSLNNFGQ
jgi:hypothetical protein